MVTATPRPRMTVILMSDSKGSDLRPYLSMVNKAIRQEWMQAQHRWAATGEVIIQFSVDRSGKVLKLALISSSGIPDFDRSVADVVISSGPLPPVPESFQGEQMLLRLKFAAH
jgi:protein TonB